MFLEGTMDSIIIIITKHGKGVLQEHYFLEFLYHPNLYSQNEQHHDTVNMTRGNTNSALQHLQMLPKLASVHENSWKT